MSSKACQYFDGCSAPVCPMDTQSLIHGAWFANEEICRRGDQAGTPMVRAQKRIAKATKRDFDRGCFNAEMLTKITKIGSATKGLDPETPLTPERVAKWISGFKGQKPLTEEQKAVLRDRALKMRGSRVRADSKNDAVSKGPVPPETENG
jgi:hypothetical protein